jgi:hypothetical protein
MLIANCRELAPPAVDGRKLRVMRDQRAGKKPVDQSERQHACLRLIAASPVPTRETQASSRIGAFPGGNLPRTQSGAATVFRKKNETK